MNMEEGLIRNTPDLKEACDALVAGGVAALDTEFVWRASFRPHLAIVQMAGADGVCRALDCQLGITVHTPGIPGYTFRFAQRRIYCFCQFKRNAD